MKYEKIIYVILSTLVVAAIIIFGFLFSPMGKLLETEATLKKIYFADNISPALDTVISKFNKKYKGQIEVIPVNLPFEKFSTNERKELLTRYLRNKSNRIDIFSVDQIWVPRFAKWGHPLNDHLTNKELSAMLSYAHKTCIINDTLVSVPLYIDIALMYYRKDLFDKLPNHKMLEDQLKKSITWEQFISLNEQIGSQNNYLFQGKDYEGLICCFVEMLGSQNVKLSKKKELLNSESNIKALQTLVDLIHKHKVSPANVTSFAEQETYSTFISNNAMFMRGWPGFLNGELQRLSKDKNLNNNVYRAPLPHFKDGKPASVFGGWNLMISKYSDNVPEAITFIKYLMSEETQKTMFEVGGYLPINKNIYNDKQYLQKYPELSFYKNLFKTGVYRPFYENYTIFSDILSFYINKALKLELSPAEALLHAENKINSNSILLK